MGMSLIEILIVLGIIAGASAAIMNAVFTKADKARIQQAKTQIAALAGDIKQYKLEKGNYPGTEEGLDVLVDSGYLEEVPMDPWNTEFMYEYPGTHGKKFEICSDGPDEDTEDDDICNYKTDEE